MVTDLTVGKPSKILWRFTLPMLISIIFQQMYNIADSIIAGNFIGDTPIENENALAAVGASYAVTMLFVQIANGINAGCAVVISQFFGSKQYVKMKTAVTTSIIATTVLSLILTVLGLFFCSPILSLLNTKAEIFDDSALYLRIYVFGLIFLFIYNVCTGIFTALGDSKTPLIFLIASSVGNVILDLIMVIPLDMGIAGVAWATFIAQGISSILVSVTLFKRVRKITTEEKPKRFSFNMLQTISKIAIPTILQQSFVSVGNLFIQGIVNDMTVATIAGYSAVIKLNTFAVNCVACLSNGLSSFTAQNIGAGKIDRITKGYKATMVMIGICLIPFLFFYLVMPEQMITLFLPEPTAEALNTGVMFLRYAAPFYTILAIKLLSDGVLRGAGAMKQFMITTFSDLILRVILAHILAPSMGFEGLCLAWPIGWVVAAALSIVFYKMGTWKNTQFSAAISK